MHTDSDKMNEQMIYVVDDDARLGSVLQSLLRNAGYECETFLDGDSALGAIRVRAPDMVLLDFMLPDTDGVEVLKKIREKSADLPVVMMSGQGTIRAAVDSIHLGAYDFLEKPLEAERVKLSVRNALDSGRLRKQVVSLKRELEDQFKMIGESSGLQRVQDMIERVAPTSVSVLITGESGTGKELVARAIHLKSPRAAETFAALNCAAIPKELIESELFGYEKGAFTGANASKTGKLQEADKGTLFLDEVADMSLEAQAKLLRFLENMEVQRLGGTSRSTLDVRILAATNKDLTECIRQGTFRDDLLHRLNVVSVMVPPLRERGNDVELLGNYFLSRYCRTYNRSVQFAPECWPVFRNYDWPGNIRELRNVIERAVVLTQGSLVEADDCRAFIGPSARVAIGGTLNAAIERAEREAVERALDQARGNISEAARILGVERPSLYRIMKRHNLTPHPRANNKSAEPVPAT